jgi:hypothetical protein
LIGIASIAVLCLLCACIASPQRWSR